MFLAGRSGETCRLFFCRIAADSTGCRVDVSRVCIVCRDGNDDTTSGDGHSTY